MLTFVYQICARVLRHCTNVTDLTLWFLDEWDDLGENLFAILNKYEPNLNGLTLHTAEQYTSLIPSIKKCVNLERFNMNYLASSAGLWKCMGSKLEYISFVPAPTGAVLDEILENCPCLKKVDFGHDFDEEACLLYTSDAADD